MHIFHWLEIDPIVIYTIASHERERIRGEEDNIRNRVSHAIPNIKSQIRRGLSNPNKWRKNTTHSRIKTLRVTIQNNIDTATPGGGDEAMLCAKVYSYNRHDLIVSRWMLYELWLLQCGESRFCLLVAGLCGSGRLCCAEFDSIRKNDSESEGWSPAAPESLGTN